MKILQINTVYKTGSTGKIVAAIEDEGIQNQHDMYVVYGRGKADDCKNHYLVGNKLDFYIHVFANFCGWNGFASKNTTKRLVDWIDSIKPDIIHLHNIHGFYINLPILFTYIGKNNIPVVWTFHDCWPFTGHCAFFDYIGCQKWQKKCEKCSIHRSAYPYSLLFDNSAKIFFLKKSIFNNVNDLLIVTPSTWLSLLVKKSYLKNYPVKVINNGIDLDIFKPDKYINRERIILSVANIWDKRKGLDYILKLNEEFNNASGWKIVIIGLSKIQYKKIKKKYDTDVLPIMHTDNQTQLAEWYNRAEVFVNPTLEDNYPTTNLEALSCGTPVVTFNTGGSPESLKIDAVVNSDIPGVSLFYACNQKGDIIGIKGAVVEKGNIEALKKSITCVINDNKKNNINWNCEYLDEKKCFKEYFVLYDSVVNSNCI